MKHISLLKASQLTSLNQHKVFNIIEDGDEKDIYVVGVLFYRDKNAFDIGDVYAHNVEDYIESAEFYCIYKECPEPTQEELNSIPSLKREQ